MPPEEQALPPSDSQDEFQWTEEESGDDFDLLNSGMDDMDDEFLLTRASGRRGGHGATNAEGTRPRGRRPGEGREEQLDPDVAELVGKANQSYGIGQYGDAIAFAEEALSIDGQTRSAYNLLCSIYEDMGEPRKALVAKVAAAHLNKTNKSDWIEIAERSYELGLLYQALQFYQHASRIARDDWLLLLRRSQLHLATGEYQRSLTLLRRIRTRFFDALPDDSKTSVLLEMARVLKQMGDPEEATNVYLDIYNRSMEPARYGEPEVPLNWQNLNVLGELLYDQKQYQQAVIVIRSGSRWILGRAETEMFWEQPPYNVDDAEFDERRKTRRLPQVLDPDDSKYDLPIDIRVWLLVLRLRLLPKRHAPARSVDNILKHLDILVQHQPIEDYADLYQRAAAALFQAKMFHQALELYVQLSEAEWEDQSEYVAMLARAGQCQMHLGSLRQAEALYDAVIQYDRDNIDALVGLAEIFHSTDRAPAAEVILDRVQELRAREGSLAALGGDGGGADHDNSIATSSAASDVDDLGMEREHSAGVFLETPSGGPSGRSTRLTKAERAEIERRAQERADAGFDGLERFRAGFDAQNPIAAAEWIRHALDLIDLFASHRKFFPSDRSKVSVLNAGNDSFCAVSEQISQLQVAPELESVSEEDAVGFRGRSIDVWFTMFMQCALAQAFFQEHDALRGVLETLRIAKSANVFYLDPHRETVIILVQLSCANHFGDGPLISETLRHLYMQRQFNASVLLMYPTFLANFPQVFGSSNNQKFFLRQIKAVDSAVQGETIEGAARVVDAGSAPTEESPLLFSLYAFIMLLGPSYVPALTYMLRAHEHLPRDPIVLLTLGVIHLQRAIQRVSTNRHLQILEGLSYMQEYLEVRGCTGSEEARQEALYNMGRFFHGIGMFSLSIDFYQRAMALKGTIKLHAAYNLHLVYALSGNMAAARAVLDAHLVI